MSSNFKEIKIIYFIKKYFNATVTSTYSKSMYPQSFLRNEAKIEQHTSLNKRHC